MAGFVDIEHDPAMMKLLEDCKRDDVFALMVNKHTIQRFIEAEMGRREAVRIISADRMFYTMADWDHKLNAFVTRDPIKGFR